MSIKDDIGVVRNRVGGYNDEESRQARYALDRIEKDVASLTDEKFNLYKTNGELGEQAVEAIVAKDEAGKKLAAIGQKLEDAERKLQHLTFASETAKSDRHAICEMGKRLLSEKQCYASEAVLRAVNKVLDAQEADRSKIESIDRITAENADFRAQLESALEERDNARRDLSEAAERIAGIDKTLKTCEDRRDEHQRRITVLEGQQAAWDGDRLACKERIERLTAMLQASDREMCAFFDVVAEWNNREYSGDPLWPAEIQEAFDRLRAAEKFINNPKAPVADIMQPIHKALDGARASVESMQRALSAKTRECGEASRAAFDFQQDTRVLVRALEIVNRVNAQRPTQAETPQTQEAR